MCPWLILVDIWQKLTQYCKAIILQVKINKNFKKMKTTSVINRKRKANNRNPKPYTRYKIKTFCHTDSTQCYNTLSCENIPLVIPWEA